MVEYIDSNKESQKYSWEQDFWAPKLSWDGESRGRGLESSVDAKRVAAPGSGCRAFLWLCVCRVLLIDLGISCT